MEEGGNGGGKCDMRERRAREQHREKKIDARWREREEQREVVLLKIASAWIRERKFFLLSLSLSLLLLWAPQKDREIGKYRYKTPTPRALRNSFFIIYVLLASLEGK